MSNTPNDDILFELIKEHFGLDKRPFDTVIDRKTGRFHDAARYRDFASAVLARWGTPQPVVREPLTQGQIESLLWTYGYDPDVDRMVAILQAARGIAQKGGGNADT